VKVSVYVGCPSVLSLVNLKPHKTKAVKKILHKKRLNIIPIYKAEEGEKVKKH